ncbi:MAG: TetR/AcrR family transcriptional regulator [Acidobacteriota bacterium]|nr:TetR/AcrR family transcriptional regulator [Acidobacteriota bacterium]
MARTPSTSAHEKVIQAALDLIVERGIDGVSMDAIAGAAGVSKATVYKHWANKDALLIDVIRKVSGELPEFDSGNPKADLIALLRYLSQVKKMAELGRIWMRVVSYALANAEFAKALHEHAFGPRRRQISRLLTQAAASGEIQPGIDPDLAMDLLIGPIIHRRFVDEKNVPPDLPDRVVDYFWQWAKVR